MAESEQMGGWRSGYDWYLTARSATIFGIQGEVFYFFFLIFPFPFWGTVKLFFAVLIAAVVAKIFGYSMSQLLRRIGRFWLGRERKIYSSRSNFLRLRIGA
jgi:hypothetical protein